MKSFWAGGYFAETVGKKNLKMIKEYIQSQLKYHGDKD
ncbi:hypothetical protein COT75_01975 [Candidatus Beckwithbacteria bacterium CG10_big_fil_rev_8_21_14_0_10_34_10]|uniref:Transposase IS200-like domain-containing protein n=1 Tax=Candidatus Beckwithbacteria bacterium CG10_big_fil_rev_8_21_14_0_10_34_10 TaxID=1974495 RepID=A0A2H0W9W8_9BACT|nr:MAG: hypothetical protein COT75_01975 [Candidatus Beckwithbacteria bacterium CG10_big_fil_rev_8_21_14_0_10_34_10]